MLARMSSSTEHGQHCNSLPLDQNIERNHWSEQQPKV